MTEQTKRLVRFWPIIKDRPDRYQLTVKQMEALETCDFRGHKMSKFQSVELANGTKLWRSECLHEDCVDREYRMYMDILKRNSPNPYGLPEISGTAVSLTCKGNQK